MRPTGPARGGDGDEPDDGELLRRVARGDDAPAPAREAQGVFYARHVRYLFAIVLRQRSRALPMAGLSPEDLVQETFHRAFERAHTFDPTGARDADHLRARTRAWLGRIAQHLLVDHLEKRREVASSPYLEQVSCDDIDEPSHDSPQVGIVSRCLEELSERERDVLRVTALYYRAGEHQRLPNAASRELAAQWDTTNDNIRAIRTRAMKKLKVCVETHGPREGREPA